MALDYVSIGKRIKHYRTDKKMSQEELASKIGAVPKHISNIEIGAKSPGLEMVILIANALDVSADDLLTDNLKHSSSPVDTEIHDLLLDCNNDEKAILTKTVRFLKATLVAHGV
jgi:transcriptional regulator with XRE-family HTH domain